MANQHILSPLAKEGEALLGYTYNSIRGELLHLPTPHFIDKLFIQANRNPQQLRRLAALFNHVRLLQAGFLSILSIDQEIGYMPGASASLNSIFSYSENRIRLAIKDGCNKIAATFGKLAFLGRKYTQKVAFIVKIGFYKQLNYLSQQNQITFRAGEDARNPGVGAVCSIIYYSTQVTSKQNSRRHKLYTWIKKSLILHYIKTNHN